jgi:phospholipid/cholesterol/gamma-HCH transport system substrate-binding protein
VPVTNTTEPVSLLDLFNIFNLPTRQRFQVIVDELGIGTAGRGADFNDILRRANPALALARQAIAILARQRAQLATIVDATNTIAAQGAAHTASVQSFLDRSAALSSLTAAHSDNLSLAVNRLPQLLSAAQPALSQLDAVAANGAPLLAQIHAAVPSLNRVSSDLGPFAAVAKPALAKLATALSRAIPAIRDTTPLVRTLRTYTARSLPGTLEVSRLFANLQRHGFVENFLSVAYYIAASLSRFDSTSHLLPLLLVGAHNGACGNYTTTPVPGCSAHYGQQPSYTRGAHSAGRAARSPASSATAGGDRSRPSVPRPALPLPAAVTAKAPLPVSAAPVGQVARTLQSLVDYLLK